MSPLAVEGPARAIVHPIDLARHDEIVLVQSLDFLGAQRDGRVTPAEADVGVMAFGLGELTDFLNKGERFPEIAESKSAFDAVGIVCQLPIGSLCLQALGSSRVSGGMPPRQGVHVLGERFAHVLVPKTISGVKGDSGRALIDRSLRTRCQAESSTITEFGNTLLLGAMITTEESPILLKAVADNSDTTCRTDGCERMDRALEAIVGVSLSVLGYLECFVVIVSAGFTFGHGVTVPEVLGLSIRLTQCWHNKFPL